MKKFVVPAIILLAVGALVIGGVILLSALFPVDKTTASYNGRLHVDGARILNRHNEEVQLKGISTQGIQWFGDLYNQTSIAEIKKEFSINVFRIAMYVRPEDGGFVANRALKDKVIELADAAIELDMYAIIDWHVLNEYTPLTYQAEALEFFGEMSAKYGETPNVIFEICNEPNGREITWKDHIKPYAEQVVAKIRKNAPESLIIVGTPEWSKDIVQAEVDPLDDKNVAYALHFYAGSENVTLRDTMDRFRESNLALFVSECGGTDASGHSKLYEDNLKKWVDFLDERKISWVYWAFSNKDEASSLVTEKYKPGVYDEEKGLADYLSENGQLLKRMLAKPED
ncbi:glycoside hydrolase family 5 protein [Candidatus Saccharibacteria bacterium]|nr:glycoside hydrolase family 5 protein [Candidatus Saccharibacteria bacterium]